MTRAGGICAPVGILSLNNLAETKATIGTGLSGIKKEQSFDDKDAADATLENKKDGNGGADE